MPLPESLRLHCEPCRSVSDDEVHAALIQNPRAYLDSLSHALAQIAERRWTVEKPPKRIFEDPDEAGDFRVMPCVVRSTHSVTKTVKVVGTNLRGEVVPDQVTVGKALALHPEENFVTHIFDACLLSSARTGACAALAMARLHPEVRSLAIVGSGRVAFYAAVFAAEIGIERIVVHDIRTGRAEKLAEDLTALIGSRIRVEASEGPAATTDVLLLATTAVLPLLSRVETLAKLVVSVGADTYSQRELDASWAALPSIWVDTLDSLEVGDLKAWIAEGHAIPPLRDFEDLMRNDPSGEPWPRLFISTGSALFDNLTIAYLLNELAPPAGVSASAAVMA